MRVAVVYLSVHHGNTRRIAEAIADTLDAELFTVDEALTVSGGNFDLVGFGSGIYFGRHHRALRKFINDLPAVPAQSFIFSTAGLPSLGKIWHRSLAWSLRRRGSTVVGEFCCPGWDTVGPLWLFGGLHRERPNEHDLKRAMDFAISLHASVLHTQSKSAARREASLG